MARVADRFLVLATALDTMPAVDRKSISLDERDHQVGVIRGEAVFVDGSCFRFVEHLDVAAPEQRRRYAYEYRRRPRGALVFRYDNVPHHGVEGLETFPHHVHRDGGMTIECAEPPDPTALLEGLKRHIRVRGRPSVAEPVDELERRAAG